MKKSFLAVVVALMLLLTSCKFSISFPVLENKETASEPFTKVIEYELYAHQNPDSYGFKASDEVGLTGNESGVVNLELTSKQEIFHYGNVMYFTYKNTIVDDINDSEMLSTFNRGYDVYSFAGKGLEYWMLRGTNVICGYRKHGVNMSAPNEALSSIGFKACSDEFLNNVMPTGWKEEYSNYSFIKPQSATDTAVAIYTREIAGYLTDDVLRVEMSPSGEVCSFEAFGRKKYDILQNTVSNEALSNAEALLDEFLIADEFKALKKSSALVVTDKNGQLYLKKVLTTADNDDYVNAFFVKISSSVLEMSDEYREMIEENYKANKALDENPETTTKNRLINDQNGELVAKFSYGAFSADYNSCGAIAVHNAKVLLGHSSMLSDTIYDIQKTSGMTLGGVFGSGSTTVPDVMEKYGIKCTEINVAGSKTTGVYIISFWHNNPPWNGTHTIAIRTQNGKQIAYNLYGDGEVYEFDAVANRDSIISCYRVG